MAIACKTQNRDHSINQHNIVCLLENIGYLVLVFINRLNHMNLFVFLYLSIYSIGFLSPAVEEGPTFVFNIADVNIISVVFPERDSGPAEHKQVISM